MSIAIGLSSGFLEPLESTSLHLIQAGIAKLLAFFQIEIFDPMNADEFNRIANSEVERFRDFLILHYHLNQRSDGELVEVLCADVGARFPAGQDHHFRRYGRLIQREFDLFGQASWLAVHIGQLNVPERVDPLLHHRSVNAVEWLAKLRAALQASARQLPTHQAFIDRFCRAV
jgi:tryptophan halogenase